MQLHDMSIVYCDCPFHRAGCVIFTHFPNKAYHGRDKFLFKKSYVHASSTRYLCTQSHHSHQRRPCLDVSRTFSCPSPCDRARSPCARTASARMVRDDRLARHALDELIQLGNATCLAQETEQRLCARHPPFGLLDTASRLAQFVDDPLTEAKAKESISPVRELCTRGGLSGSLGTLE